jgi:hypothetical protein
LHICTVYTYMRKYYDCEKLNHKVLRDWHILSPLNLKSGFWNAISLCMCLNVWLDFIHVQYVRMYVIGQCQVNMNLLASRIWWISERWLCLFSQSCLIYYLWLNLSNLWDLLPK